MDIDLSIGVASIGGCSLAQHCAIILGEPQEVAGSVYYTHEFFIRYSNAVAGITDENSLIAYFAALYSCKYPFSVTDSTNLVYANRYGVDSE